jgi:hypothetical protein
MTTRAHVEEVLRALGFTDTECIESLRAEGLFAEDEISMTEAEQLRIAVVLMREMGVNAAGVEVILHLRSRLLALQTRTEHALRLVLDDLR